MSEQDNFTLFRETFNKIYQNQNNVLNLLTEKIGMIIPPLVNNKLNYIKDNLKDYKDVINRNPSKITMNRELLEQISDTTISSDSLTQLKFLTDLELFDFFRIYVPYDSRNSLVIRLADIVYNDRVFIPLSENIDSIGYGTPFNYTTVKFKNLLNYIEESKDANIQISKYITLSLEKEGCDLFYLMKSYSNIPIAKQIVKEYIKKVEYCRIKSLCLEPLTIQLPNDIDIYI